MHVREYEDDMVQLRGDHSMFIKLDFSLGSCNPFYLIQDYDTSNCILILQQNTRRPESIFENTCSVSGEYIV